MLTFLKSDDFISYVLLLHPEPTDGWLDVHAHYVIDLHAEACIFGLAAGVDAITLLTNYHGHYLAAPAFPPVFDWPTCCAADPNCETPISDSRRPRRSAELFPRLTQATRG